jgi:hypothetical protein
MIRVASLNTPRSFYNNPIIVNATSQSPQWKGLSPFNVGPVNLYDGHTSVNVENAWQFSKVYKQHVDENGDPTAEYFEWSKTGWADSWAHRYPMGKGAVPEYSYWDGEKLGYIEARKKIYIPLYASAVVKTDAYQKLLEVMELAEDTNRDLVIKDYDAYDNKGLNKMSYDDVINCETRKMGHGFVLAMLLDSFLKGYEI